MLAQRASAGVPKPKKVKRRRRGTSAYLRRTQFSGYGVREPSSRFLRIQPFLPTNSGNPAAATCKLASFRFSPSLTLFRHLQFQPHQIPRSSRRPFILRHHQLQRPRPRIQCLSIHCVGHQHIPRML